MGHLLRNMKRKIVAPGMVCSLVGLGFSGLNGSWNTDVPVKQATTVNLVKKEKLPTGGFEFQEISVTEEQAKAMPVFTGKNGKVKISASYAVSDWNDSTKVTYGCSTYGYNNLTDNQKSAYMKLLYATAGSNLDGTGDCFMASSTLEEADGYKVECPSGVTVEDMEIAYCAFYEDHPEFYWLKSGYSFYNNTIIILVDGLYDTKAERTAIDTAIKSTEGERATLLAAYDSGTGEYGKMIALHNQIMEDVTYAYDGSQPESAAWAHNVEGVLSESHKDTAGKRKVVCEGYAKTFQYILNIRGIDNIYVVGTASGSGHAWNMISIDGTWYDMDLTWDDYTDGYGYLYTCMPASFFEKKHTAYTKKSDFWVYDLPTADDTTDLSNTYFGKYNAYATSATCSDAEVFVKTAGASSPNEDLAILSNSTTCISSIARVLNLSSYMVASEYNGYYIFVKGGAAKYKVTVPATDLSIDKSSYTLDMTKEESFPLTFSTTTTDCDDYVSVEVSDTEKAIVNTYCVPISEGKAEVTVSGKRNGAVTIKASAMVGSVEPVSCAVIVTGSALAQTMYTDSSCSTAVKEEDMVAYINGGKVKSENGNTVNKKVIEVYTDMETPVYQNAKNKQINGKIVVGITSSTETPTLKKGKIVSDAGAKNIAKATIAQVKGSSGRKVTITALKDAGEVYLWVLGLGADNKIVSEDYCPVTIKAAPSKITLQDKSADSQDAIKYTKAFVAMGDSVKVYLKPEYKDTKKQTIVTEDATFTPDLGKDSSYASVTKISNYEYQITANALKNSKVTTVKISFVCNENGKKADFSLSFGNPVTEVTTVSVDKTTLENKDEKSKIEISIKTAGGTELATTDKAKVYIANGISGSNSYIISKSSVYKGEISGTNVTITRKKETKESATVYILYKDKITAMEVAYPIAVIDKTGTITLS